MTEDKVRKAEYPLNSQGLGYRSTLENGPYFKDDVGYSEPLENERFQFCGACAFYRDGGCSALEEDIHILASCILFIDMGHELGLRWEQFLLVNRNVVKSADEPEVVEKYIAEEGGKYCVRSHQTGKNFGCYDSKAAAEKRLAQIKRFKEEATTFQVKFASMDEEKRLVYGEVLVPDDVDYHEDTITAEEVEKAAHGYMGKPMIIGNQHTKKAKAYPVESFIVNKEMLKNVSEGSWVMAVKVKDDVIWEGIKDGSYTGFSIGALVHRNKIEDLEEEI